MTWGFLELHSRTPRRDRIRFVVWRRDEEGGQETRRRHDVDELGIGTGADIGGWGESTTLEAYSPITLPISSVYSWAYALTMHIWLLCLAVMMMRWSAAPSLLSLTLSPPRYGYIMLVASQPYWPLLLLGPACVFGWAILFSTTLVWDHSTTVARFQAFSIIHICTYYTYLE